MLVGDGVVTVRSLRHTVSDGLVFLKSLLASWRYQILESNTDFNAGMLPMGPDVLSKSPNFCIQLLLLISSLGDCPKFAPKFGVTKKAHNSLQLIRKKDWVLGDHLNLQTLKEPLISSC